MKEGFFRNYELAQLSPLTRILFEGLWCLADKNGRLWDRPQQIKAECLPYDECNVEEMLNSLATAGFIRRYEAREKKCIEVVNFDKHQVLTSWEKGLPVEVPAPKGLKPASKRLQDGIEVRQDENVPRARALEQNSNEQNRSEVKGIEPPFHGDLFLSTLADFEQHRKDIHKTLKPTGRKSLYAKLESFGEQIATRSLRQSIENGWTGVFEPRGNGANGNGRETTSERNVRNLRESLAVFQGSGGEDNPQESVGLVATDADRSRERITR